MDAIESALAAFGFENLPAVPVRSVVRSNGHGWPVQCFGCQKEFISHRRPSETRHSWCSECVAAGKPGAQRVKEFRLRKKQGVA